MPAAVVLLSGGLDSYTAAAVAKRDGFDLYALSVRYGQRHAHELAAAGRVAAALDVKRHLEIEVDLSRMGGSALTSDLAVPKDQPIDPAEIPVTYVPARNTVFLSLALGWAEVVGAADLVIGVNALDYSGYPDCRPEFIRAFEAVARLATKAGVGGQPFTVHAPLIALSKAEIVAPGRIAGSGLRTDAQLLRPVARRPAVRPLRQLPAARARLCRSGHRRPARGRGILAREAMTERLYYTDAYRRQFEATRHIVHAGRRAFEVVLDRTAFYPTSGGQPLDLGTVGRAPRARRRRPRGRRCASTSSTGRSKSARRSPASSTGPGASTTCSSTPASTCCRRRSSGVPGAHRELPPGRGQRHHRSAPRRDTAGRSRAAEDEANRVVVGGPAGAIRFVDRRRGRGAAAAQGVRIGPARCA